MAQLVIENLTEINNAASCFLELTKGHTKFAFYGEMGAGKTTFIKAICNKLGAIDTATSPSFSIVNEYHTNQGYKIFHFDFYRIKKLEEAYDIGFEEYFYSNDYCFIEWPDKIESILPDDVVPVIITTVSESMRKVKIG